MTNSCRRGHVACRWGAMAVALAAVIVSNQAVLGAAETKPATAATVRIEAEPASLQSKAAVQINGKLLGSPPIALSLQPGRYLVEVTSTGYEPWRQWLDLSPGQKVELRANLRAQVSAAPTSQPAVPSTGALIVACDVLDATVAIDGKPAGTVPVLASDIAPGEHVVEVRAPSGEIRSERVTVVAGETLPVRISLRAATAPAGPPTLAVVSEPPGAEVVVDGTSRGLAPITLNDLGEGEHLVEGRMEGRIAAERRVTLKLGQTEAVKLVLLSGDQAPRTGGLQVTSSVPDAEVLVDGEVVGKVPVELGEVLVGAHVVTVRAPGYEEQVSTVDVKPGEQAQLAAKLRKPVVVEETSPSEAPPRAWRWGEREGDVDPFYVVSRSAALVPPEHVTFDATAGFPYLLDTMMTVGVLDRERFGLDAGVGLRTYGAVTEVAARTRLRFFDWYPYSVAGGLTLGGGGGPKSRNTFFLDLSAIGSVWIRRVALSASATLSFYTDRHCPENPSDNELGVCLSPPDDLTTTAMRERFGGVRVLLGATMEVPVSSWLNIFAGLDVAPFQGNRRAFSDRFAAIMPDSDPGFYGRIGVTIKR